ncbi:fatty acid--CoA ligase family protein [Actinocorallia libanotica]|uniref:AMP-binding protein n=1 Tax=Actinocorallia libanotica TaxID=46162 RepID=A0ABN1RMA6_9ACTN
MTPRLSGRIAEVAAADPAARALEFRGRWHTWAELAAAMDRIDGVIDAHAGGGTAVVGVPARNTPLHVALLLAVLRRGGCFVVINPARGRESVRSDVAGLGLRLVLGQTADIEELAGATDGTALVAFDDLDADARVQHRPARPAEGRSRPGVAVRMPTSGTTGPPKRIDLAYDALDASMAVAKHYEAKKRDPARRPSGVALVNSPLAHMGGVFRVLQCVLDGRAFVFFERFDLRPWLEAVRTYRPKTVSLVPAALRMVLEADPDPADLSSLRAVTSGTAPLAPEDADAFTARFGVPVLTSYAATEFAGGVAGWTLRDHEKHWSEKRGSAGRAQPGCALRVVDEHTHDVLGPDRPGLLEVRPAQLGRDAGWMRTNDLARIDADGFLYILGRADQAIIRGGFKVLPDRVRSVLEALPDVRGAVVLGVPDGRLGEVPAALVEPRPGAAPDPAALRAEAARSLAGYEVPKEVHIVAELPRTTSGKVDLGAAKALLREVSA